MNKVRPSKLRLFMTVMMAGLCAVPIEAQTTAFTYQGRLTDSGNPANGNYDFQFKLFDAFNGGTQQGATLSQASVAVSGGIFNVTLDFGTSVFTGADRFLEISVKPAGSPGGYQQLLPRQPITSSPYAIQTVNATQLGGLPSSRYVATDANGKVGIGTATPSTKLEVVDPVRQLRFGPTTEDNGGYLISTRPSQAIMIGGAKWDDPNWVARDTSASMTQHYLGKIEFFTNNNLTVGSTFGPIGRMVIDANGNVGIGTTSPQDKLHVAGQVRADGVYVESTTNLHGVWGVNTGSPGGSGVYGFSNNTHGVHGSSNLSYGVYGTSNNSYAGYFQGNVFVTGTVSQGSDARLKQGISTLAYGLSEVLRLRPVTWRWKDHPERGPQLGLVAQDVEPLLPELVSTDKDAEQMKGLNYVGLLPVLVNAIQEQQAQIEKQAHEINRLKQREQQQSKTQQSQIQLRQQINQQRDEISRLKQLVCLDHPKAALCRKAH